MRKRVPVLGAVLSLATVALAGPGVAAADTDTAADILQAGAELGVSDGYPGVIGLVRDGDDAEYVAAGEADRFKDVPADPQHRFRIGSNTKAFVATVLLQLEAEGKLSLDDTVATWLPDAVNTGQHDGSTITVRQLLNHSSGLPEYLDAAEVALPYAANLNPHQQYEPQALVDIALKRAPVGAPGEKFFYSNTNYILAGMVIEAVTGNHPATEIEQRIIEPLGLTDTSYPTEPTTDGEWMSGHFWATSLLIRDVTVSNVQVSGAAGAMVSTLDDLATFERALLTGELLPEQQLEELKTLVPASEDGTAGYGLGVIKAETPCGPVWQHTGGVLGYFTLWLTSDDGEKQVVLAANEFHLIGGTKGQQDVGQAALDAYCAL
ncbi:serine hydrolase [Saccharomonospora sp. NB11]|uniref:serine hydrolase domain-containing protein n=1 Tax=Saccharomonospora sp. NB11 TaxID=1642298 RepID=UPI0018D14DF4|nr:serine hydrolase domain-containing protein [Saccharomonospora sp. NB11]